MVESSFDQYLLWALKRTQSSNVSDISWSVRTVLYQKLCQKGAIVLKVRCYGYSKVKTKNWQCIQLNNFHRFIIFIALNFTSEKENILCGCLAVSHIRSPIKSKKWALWNASILFPGCGRSFPEKKTYMTLENGTVVPIGEQVSTDDFHLHLRYNE